MPVADTPPVDVELETLIRARYPIVYVVSWEERRVEETIREICQRRGKKMLLWTVTTGMQGNASAKDPLAALDHILNAPDQTVFVLKDFHPFISDVTVTRRLRDLVGALKTSYKTLIILSPLLKLPPELDKEITVVDYHLPTLRDLDRLLEGIIQSIRSNPKNADISTELTPLEREQILKAASGLTSNEAENVFAKSLVEKRRFDIDTVLSEKEQIIRKSGILEYYRATEAFADVGGMDLLKEWMNQRTASFTDEAKRYGLPDPKGILLLGVQGGGKSLAAKAIASLWKLPLLRLDVGRIFAGIVGSSEENMRKAIATAESVAPAILWIDELEKGFAGTQSSGISDGGTTSRVFGTFITWMQDKKAPVFVVATSNDVSQLPPEMLRKGRFDEIFFVDLPAVNERKEIFEIHLKKRHRDPARFDLDLLAHRTMGFSGAEIEQVVVSALVTTFSENARELTTDDLVKAARSTVPLSVTMREGVAKLREWAETRARQTSSVQSESTEELAALDQFGNLPDDDEYLPPSASGDGAPDAAATAAAARAGSQPGAAEQKTPWYASSGSDATAAAAADSGNEIDARLAENEARIAAVEAKTGTGMDPILSQTQNLDRAPVSMPVVEAQGTGLQDSPPIGADTAANSPDVDGGGVGTERQE